MTNNPFPVTVSISRQILISGLFFECLFLPLSLTSHWIVIYNYRTELKLAQCNILLLLTPCRLMFTWRNTELLYFVLSLWFSFSSDFFPDHFLFSLSVARYIDMYNMANFSDTPGIMGVMKFTFSLFGKQEEQQSHLHHPQIYCVITHN